MPTLGLKKKKHENKCRSKNTHLRNQILATHAQQRTTRTRSSTPLRLQASNSSAAIHKQGGSSSRNVQTIDLQGMKIPSQRSTSDVWISRGNREDGEIQTRPIVRILFPASECVSTRYAIRVLIAGSAFINQMAIRDADSEIKKVDM